jgi:signal transduction histidine kinase
VALDSGATHVRIAYGQAGSRYRFAIRDNGPGFDPTQAGGTGGIGILNMHERALAVAAGFRLDSSPGQGASILVDF